MRGLFLVGRERSAVPCRNFLRSFVVSDEEAHCSPTNQSVKNLVRFLLRSKGTHTGGVGRDQIAFRHLVIRGDFSSRCQAGKLREGVNQMTRHVLIVNDNHLICTVTANILRRHGYRASTALSAEQAISMVNKEPPNLMLVDIVMPHVNGVQMVEEMESPPPFLIHSALPDDDDRVIRLLELGGLGRVKQPSLLSDVENTFEKLDALVSTTT